MAPLLLKGALALLVGSLLASAAVADPFEKLFEVPEGWKLEGPAADDQPLRLQIALQQGDVEGFEQAVLDMSTPSHPKYGQHFQSHEEVKRMLLPSDQAIASVNAWLHQAGIEEVEVDADWINFRTTAGTANKLLDTTFQWYSTTEGKALRILRTLEYTVPAEVAKHINLVQPTTRFGQMRPNHWTSQPHEPGNAIGKTFAAAALNESDCNSVIHPQCLKQLYKIDYTASAKSGSKIAFCSYLEQYARYSDLALFEANIAPYAIGQNFSVITYNGGLNNQTSDEDSGEANLDLQYEVGVGHPLPVTEFSTGGRGPWVSDLDQPTAADNYNEPYLAFLQNVLKMRQKDLPQVISTSYGENEQSVPKSYALSVCNLFAQLGARGVTVVFSSGDSGTGSACQSNDGKNRTMFQPQYPAACPWVTSVGGTQYLDEQAVAFSSGGFSNYWSRPVWQELAVPRYLKKLGDKFSPYYNHHGRGFPDVAAQSVAYSVYEKGRLVHYRGTSCSAPAFAAIVGLLNDARLKAGLPTLGFLNPLIYLVGSHAFNDITKGGSTGCDGHGRFNGPPNGSPVIPYASWNATEGWDPVTGLGTPNFPKLLKLAVPSRHWGR